VIDAAESHAHRQHDRQAEHLGEIGEILAIVERHEKAARTFHHDRVGAARQRLEAIADAAEFDRSPLAGRRDVRCDRSEETVGVDLVERRVDIRCDAQRFDVFVLPAPGGFEASGCHGFHACGPHAESSKCVNEPRRDQCLADLRVGAGDEEAARHPGSSRIDARLAPRRLNAHRRNAASSACRAARMSNDHSS